MAAFRTSSPSPGSHHENQKVEPSNADFFGTYSCRVDPADLCLEFRESDKQYHVKVPRVPRFAVPSPVCMIRSGGEVRLYSAQCLKLVCLT